MTDNLEKRSALHSGIYRMALVGAVVTERSEKVNATEYPALSVGQAGVTPQLAGVAKTQNISDRKLVCEGDLVINSRSDRRGASGLSPATGGVSPVYSVMTPKEGIFEGKYAHHLFRSKAFQDEFFRWGVGIVDDLWSTNFTRMSRIRIPLPDTDTQRAIADYLDRETGEIDVMIAKMDELAEELKQRRRNAITESFESRMANTAPIWSFADVRPSNVDKKSKPDELAVKLVNYTDVYYSKAITPDLDLMIATASDEHIKRFAVLPGDVIITKDSEGPDDIGVPAIIERSDADMVCAYHLTLLRPYQDKCYPKYLFWAFESKTTKDYWLTASFGVTRYSIGAGVISRLPIPDLPLDEQRRIADHLDEVTSRIDTMLAKVAELKSLLTERRAALITDVVTGRKEVA